MLSENLKIEIRPIPNRQNIQKLSDKLEFYSKSHIVAPFVDPTTRRYKTGLSEKDIEFLKEKKFPYDIDDIYVQGTPHKFWESPLIKVELRNNPMFLYPGKSLLDFVKYKFLLVSNFVYTSEAEMKTGSKPQATHYIYNEDVEMNIQASKIAKRNLLLNKIAECSLDKKRNLILILNNENTDNKTEDYLNVKLEEIINSNRRHELEKLLTEDDSNVNIMSLIKNAVRKQVLKKTRKGYFYFDANLGLTEEDVIAFLSNPENQEILFTIKDKI